jgi:hypothetical protein
MVHNHTSTRAVPANEDGRGNLSGHEARCSCGFVARTSLSALFAERDVAEHAAFMARKGGSK